MKNPYIQRLKKMVLSHFSQYKVQIYLFGSRARGTAKSSSDVDIAVLPQELVPDNIFSELREIFEESDIPYRVDLVDLSTVGDPFKKVVLSEGIVWKG